MAASGALAAGRRPAAGLPVREIRFRNVSFSYPGAGLPVLNGFDLAIPAGSSLAIVGQNGAGKTTLAKLLCRMYDPQRDRSRSTASICARSISRAGGSASRRCSRTSPGSSCRCATTSRRPARRTRRSAPRSTKLAPQGSPGSTRSWPAAMKAARSCRVASGSVWRWHGRSAPCGLAREWCCSTSRPPSSTCAAKPRSSIGS